MDKRGGLFLVRKIGITMEDEGHGMFPLEAENIRKEIQVWFSVRVPDAKGRFLHEPKRKEKSSEMDTGYRTKQFPFCPGFISELRLHIPC